MTSFLFGASRKRAELNKKSFIRRWNEGTAQKGVTGGGGEKGFGDELGTRTAGGCECPWRDNVEKCKSGKKKKKKGILSFTWPS